jgi:lysophospholipase L1-like esterase
MFLAAAGACGSEAGDGLAPQSIPTARIMPLGDSITESTRNLTSYRYYLWHLALDKGYRVDFVGSRQGVGNGPPANADFDLDHEGHSGWRADEIVTRIQTWAAAASPDIVLLHVGHNDLCQGQSVAGTVADVEAIVDGVRTVNPHVKILLAQVIASSHPCHAAIPAFNASLPALAAEKTSDDSPIVIVDQYTGFDTAAMTYDGTHPNAGGDARMADRWFDRLAPLLDAFVAVPHS